MNDVGEGSAAVRSFNVESRVRTDGRECERKRWADNDRGCLQVVGRGRGEEVK